MKERYNEDRFELPSEEGINVKLNLPLGEYAVSIFMTSTMTMILTQIC